MKLKNWVFVIGLFFLPLVQSIKSQEAIMPSAQQPVQPTWQPSQMQYNGNTFDAYYTPPPPPAGPDEPFQAGAWVFRPQLAARLIYASALLAKSNDVESTSIMEFSPGIIVDYNPHWEFSYIPTIRFYSNKQFQNEFNNTFNATCVTTFQDWIFGFVQSVIQTSQPNLQTGEQTMEEVFLTKFTGSYAFDSKTSTDLSFNQNVRFTGDFNNTREWSSLGWFNFELAKGFVTSIGGGLGYVDVDIGPNQVYEQLLARIAWHAGQKLFFALSGGLEEREYFGEGGGSPTFNPIFSAAVVYQITHTTTLSASASKAILPSYYAGLVSDTTSASVSLTQRFFKKYYLNLSGSYSMNKFEQATSSPVTTRQDDYYTLNAGISRPFGKRGSIAANYQYSDQKSTMPGFSYKGSQIGVELSYRY